MIGMLTELNHLNESRILFPQPWCLPGFGVALKPGFLRGATVAKLAVCESPAVLPCAGCREREARIAELQQQLAALQDRNHKLEESVRRNASNSSIPPSANPPDAPKPTAKKPTGRKRGGQPGHPVPTRTRLPPERVQHLIPFVPRVTVHPHS